MATQTAFTTDVMSGALRKQFLTLKPQALAVTKSFAGVREKLTELAPKLMKLFRAAAAEADTRGMRAPTFADFCRWFDPTVPTSAQEYRVHRTYYSFDYMRRLERAAADAAARKAEGKGGDEAEGKGKADPKANTIEARTATGVRDSAVDALARVLKTILQVAPDPAPVWAAVQKEFDFSQNIITRLQKRVEVTKPLFSLQARAVKVGNVIHMTPEERATETETREPLAQPGRSVVLPAPSEGPQVQAAPRRRRRAA